MPPVKPWRPWVARPARRPGGHAGSPRHKESRSVPPLARSLPSLLGAVGTHLRVARRPAPSCSARPACSSPTIGLPRSRAPARMRGRCARARGALELRPTGRAKTTADPARRDAEGLDRRRAGGRGPPVLRAQRPRSSARCSAAAWANLRAGRVKEGGSTITQQLVKVRLLSPQRDVLPQAAGSVAGRADRVALFEGADPRSLT